MQGPIDRLDSGTEGLIAFGHRWSHCSRAYMLLLDPDPIATCMHDCSGTICGHHLWAPCSGTICGMVRHRWSCCIWAQMVPFYQAQIVLLYAATNSPIVFGHRWAHYIRAQIGPVYAGSAPHCGCKQLADIQLC